MGNYSPGWSGLATRLELEGLWLMVNEAKARIQLLHPELSRFALIGSHRRSLEDAHRGCEAKNAALLTDPLVAEALIVLLPDLAPDNTLAKRLLNRFPDAKAVALVNKATEHRMPAATRRIKCFGTLGSQLAQRLRAFGLPKGLGDRLVWWGGPPWIGSIGRRYVKLKSPKLVCEVCSRLPQDQISSRPSLAAWVMSVLGLGIVSPAPGTVASAVTAFALLLLGWVMPGAFFGICLTVATAATFLCVLFEHAAARSFLTKDAREVVLDEVAGMALTLLFLPWHWALAWGVTVAFFLFRLFDIVKPGIGWIERTGWRGTIVWDDLLAGLYAGSVLLLLGAIIG